MQRSEAECRDSQHTITIITSEFESFTAFADLQSVVVQKKDIVAARLRAVRILGLRDRKAVFLATDLLLVRGNPLS